MSAGCAAWFVQRHCTDMFNAYRPGDVIAYQRLPWQEPDAPCHLDIVYEDEHLVCAVMQQPSTYLL